MATNREPIERQLRELEEFLLAAGTRRSPEALSDLLAESFVEFGSSGQVYDKSAVLASLRDESTAHWSVSDFKVSELAPGVALVTYRAAKRGVNRGDPVGSLRSSIWQYSAGQWRLVFHQGTRSGPTQLNADAV